MRNTRILRGVVLGGSGAMGITEGHLLEAHQWVWAALAALALGLLTFGAYAQARWGKEDPSEQA